MNVSFLACSEGAAIDQRTQNISLFNIIDRIQSVTFPFVIPRLFIAMTFMKEAEDSDQELITVRAALGDSDLLQASLRPMFSGRQKARFMSEMPSIIIPSPGDLVISVLQKDRELATWTIEIGKLEPADDQLQLENAAPE